MSVLSDFQYNLGKLDPVWPVGLKDFRSYTTADLPVPPPTIAPPNFPIWGVLGNDTYGDCGVAGLEHGFETTAEIVDVTEMWPTDAQAISYYLKYTGGQDSGVVLSQYLQYVHVNTYYGHKVQLYAPVQYTDLTMIKTCVDLFGFAYVGINCPESALQQFNAQQPWTPVAGSPSAGGHCIIIIGYDANWLYIVTWGQVWKMSYAFWAENGDEAYAVLTGVYVAHHGDGRGVNITALEADVSQLDS